jgi:orotate phosphoribosyltransferase
LASQSWWHLVRETLLTRKILQLYETRIYYSNRTRPKISKAYFYSESTEGLVEKENTLKHNDLKHELKQLIKRKGIVVLESEITLSSGEKTNYYYDIKKVSADPKGANLLGYLLVKEVEKYHAKSVGGLESGAIQISSSVVYKSSGKKRKGIYGFFVRKQAKTHGLQKRIEGYLIKPVVVVEDVITKGKSVMQAIEAIREERVSIAGVVCVVDREDTENLLKENNIKYSSLFKHSEFKSFIETEIKKKKTEN